MNSSKVLCKTKQLKFSNSTFDLSKFGLGFVDRDQGTGYHCPKGIFISNFPSDIDSLRFNSNEWIDTTSFHEYIYNYFMND